MTYKAISKIDPGDELVHVTDLDPAALWERVTALAKQVAQLEADRCACSHCIQRRREHERLAVVSRLAAIKAMPRDERNQAIASLPEIERVTFLREYADVQTFVQAPDDVRKQWLAYAPHLRDLVEIEFVEIPRHLYLSLAPAKPGEWSTTEWSRPRFPIDFATVQRLRQAGLGDRVRRLENVTRLPAWTYLLAGEREQNASYVYQPLEFSTGQRYRYTRPQLDLMLTMDPDLADALQAGRVVITECTLDEDRAVLLSHWAAMRATSASRTVRNSADGSAA